MFVLHFESFRHKPLTLHELTEVVKLEKPAPSLTFGVRTAMTCSRPNARVSLHMNALPACLAVVAAVLLAARGARATHCAANEYDGCVSDSTWIDGSGDDCAVYEDNAYCENGSYGSGWFYGAFSDWADANGVHAGDACCICGGGTSTCTACPTGSTSPAGSDAADDCVCRENSALQASAAAGSMNYLMIDLLQLEWW